MTAPENRFVLDDAHAPLLVITQYGTISDEAYEHYLRELGKRFITIPRVLLVYDTTHARPPTATQRRLQADWLKDNARDVQRCTIGAAFCVPAMIVRGAIRAVMWLSPPGYPYVVTQTLDESLRWAAQQLQREGHPLPVPLRRFQHAS